MAATSRSTACFGIAAIGVLPGAGSQREIFSLWKPKQRVAESMVEFDQLPSAVKETDAPDFIPVVVKSKPLVAASRIVDAESPATNTGLTFKAVLRNGVAIEVQMGPVSGVMPLLSQLAQLPC